MTTDQPPETPRATAAHSSLPLTTPTTDFALIEAQKENIVPLSTGRSASILSSVFTKDRSETDKLVLEGHQYHKKLVEETIKRESEGDELPEGVRDILDPHYNYIAFITQHHPSSPTHLLPFLESTTRRFVNDTRFQQDVRYLKAWAQYARLVERSDDVWSFLNTREIGTSHALFYEEWALAVCSKNKINIADEVYRLGINRKAQPLKRLQAAYLAFQKQREAGTLGGSRSEESAPPARQTLGLRSADSQSRSTAPSQRVAQVVETNGNGAKLDVFSDAPRASGLEQQEGEWDDVGTREQNRKENFNDAIPWKGEVLKQNKSKVVPRTPKMSVFSDTSVGLPMTGSSSDAEAEDPLALYLAQKRAASGHTRPPNKEKFAGPSGIADEGPDVIGKNGKTERRMFSWTTVFPPGQEFCFEEVRARHYGHPTVAEKEVRAWESQWHNATMRTPVASPEAKRVPSPTVNTKAAMAEVFELFNQTLNHGSRAARSDLAGDDDDDDDDDEDDETSSDEDEEQGDEEDMQTSAVPATPLPPMMGLGSRPTLGTSSVAVPATPTPAQGVRRPVASKFSVFQDAHIPEVPAEDAAPGLAAGFSVFADHVGQSTGSAPVDVIPLTAGSVFQDENAVPPRGANARRSTPGIASESLVASSAPLLERLPLSTSDVVASGSAQQNVEPKTPVGPSRMFGYEWEGEERDAHVEAASLPLEANAHGAVDDEEAAAEEQQYYPRRMMRCGGAFDVMTPITERTSEYTQSTQAFTLRSSTSSALAQSQRGIYVNHEAEEKFEYDEDVFAAEEAQALSAVAEETETSSSNCDMRAAQTSYASPSSTAPSHLVDLSGDATTPLRISPGHTIQRRGSSEDWVTETVARGEEPGQNVFQSRIDEQVDERSHGEEIGDEPDSQALANGRKERLLVSVQDLPSPTASSVLGFCPSNPCCPTDPAVIQPLIASLHPPLAELSGFHDLRHVESHNLAKLQRAAKPHGKRASASTADKTSGWSESVLITLGEKGFEVTDKLGEGGFGAVFKAIDLQARQLADDASDDEDADEAAPESAYTLAVKVERPANVWEAVVLDRVRQRVPGHHRASIVKARELYCYQDESLLLLDYYDQGTLLDVVNKAQAWGIASPSAGQPCGMDETLAIFFTIELLRLIEALHGADLIHGDLKIDNCLVRLDEAEKWATQYDMTGDLGWRQKGVHLIDFGRAIDLRAYPAGSAQTFVADWPVDGKDCQEMRDGKPWSYETDYYGLAGICYCMLFGKYISSELSPAQPPDGEPRRYQVIGTFKRYWQVEMWQSLFDLLLNPKLANPTHSLPVQDEVAAIRGQFECWLEENCNKGGRNLKNLLSKLELKAGLGR